MADEQIRTERDKRRDIDVLNKMLRAEIAATETYSRCIDSTARRATRDALESLRASHTQRRDQIANRIRLMGGEPDTTSGAWGTLARVIQGTAARMSRGAALKTIREGESVRLRMYERADELTASTRRFIDTHVLPEQREAQASIEKITREYV